MASNGTSKQPLTFLTMPLDIRLEIYDWVFYSTTLEAWDCDAYLPPDLEDQHQDAEDDGDGEQDAGQGYADGTEEVVAFRTELADEDETMAGVDGNAEAANPTEPDWSAQLHAEHDGLIEEDDMRAARDIEIFTPPIMTERLNLVCRQLNAEIGHSWHGKVTYYFPCTVAFIDVLSQWPRSKIETIRRIQVCGYPLPLYPIDRPDCYCTHHIYDALPIFPGLKLDVLTVENVWLEPDGEQVDGWCLGAANYEVTELLKSSGWRRFEYLSGTLGLLLRQMRDLEADLEKMKSERHEDGYRYQFGEMRPRLSGLITYGPQGETEHDTEEDKAELAEWEVAHADADSEEQRPKEKKIQVWATRGTENYAENGEGRTQHLKGLLDYAPWIELRKAGKYLVDDGMGDFTRHL